MNRIRAIALALLAFCGLTAFMAVGASANWLESGSEVTANKNVLVKAATTLELAVPSLNIEFRCTTVKSEGLKIIGKSSKGEGKAAFSGCTAWSPANLKGSEQAKCTPENQPIVAGGIVLIKLLSLTQNGKLFNVLLLEPESGKPFTTIKLPAGCALAETSNITGSLVDECGMLTPTWVQEDCGISQSQHYELTPPSTVWWESDEKGGHRPVIDEPKYGANKATVNGIVITELESGNEWAGHV